MNATQLQLRDQAIVAREIIDLYRAFSDNSDVIEYLSRICFSQARLLDAIAFEQSSIDWHAMFEFFDQKYYALRHDTAHPDESIIARLYGEIKNLIPDTKLP